MVVEAMNAEHALLGSVLGDNRTYWDASRVVVGDDFSDPRLGAVWDGIGRALAQGGMVDVLTVADRFPEWDVRGLSIADPFTWQDAAQGVYVYATQYARAVSTDAARRFGKQVLSEGLEQLGDPGADPESVLGDVVARTQGRDAPGGELEAVTLRQILDMPESYDWVIPNLMERKDRLILTGHEGMGKSTMARQLLILPAAGLHPFTFEKIDPVKALVIDAENTAKQWKRNSAWITKQAHLQGGTDPSLTVHMVTSGRVNILDPRIQGQIHRLIDKHEPDILFIGPLYRIAVKLNTDDEAAPVIAALDAIRDRNVALVMEAHAGHATDGGGQRSVRPRGSSALMGWPEFGFGIRADPDEEGRFEFIPWRGSREQRDFPTALRRGIREAAEFPWVPAF
ncbi:DnaB helicase-like protein [Paramicrobacterium agarici]|nr:DnaB helicase-like protein [Microbacterium agarici]